MKAWDKVERVGSGGCEYIGDRGDVTRSRFLENSHPPSIPILNRKIWTLIDNEDRDDLSPLLHYFFISIHLINEQIMNE